MKVLKLQLYTMLAAVVLFAPLICTANNHIKTSSVDSSSVYLKFATGIATDYSTLEAGIGYSITRHRVDIKLGFLGCTSYTDNFIRGNYYYNIVEFNRGSIFVTGGAIKCFSSTTIGGELGVGITVKSLFRDNMHFEIECSTIANNINMPLNMRFGWRIDL